MTYRLHVLTMLALALPTVTKADVETLSGLAFAPAELHMLIGVEGTPANVTCKPAVNPTLCPILVRAVSAWKFVPGQRGSTAAEMNIGLTLHLKTVAKLGGYALQATAAKLKLATENAATPTPNVRNQSPPKYSHRDMKMGRTGTATLELMLRPESDEVTVGRA